MEAPSRPPAVSRRPGEQAWRAVGSAAARIVPNIAMRRPVDLVWPDSPGGSEAPGDTQRFGTASTPGAAPARPIPAPAQPATAPSRTSGNTVVCATALDPALAGRLADEVIRRLDHRARIERERRGL